MKKLICILVVIVLAVGAYMFLGNRNEVNGKVISVNTDSVALDGPTLITISTKKGEEVIAVPSMGINLCAAKDNIVDVYSLTTGQEVSVSGNRDEEGRIVPCEEASHYLRAK